VLGRVAVVVGAAWLAVDQVVAGVGVPAAGHGASLGAGWRAARRRCPRRTSAHQPRVRVLSPQPPCWRHHEQRQAPPERDGSGPSTAAQARPGVGDPGSSRRCTDIRTSGPRQPRAACHSDGKAACGPGPLVPARRPRTPPTHGRASRQLPPRGHGQPRQSRWFVARSLRPLVWRPRWDRRGKGSASGWESRRGTRRATARVPPPHPVLRMRTAAQWAAVAGIRSARASLDPGLSGLAHVSSGSCSAPDGTGWMWAGAVMRPRPSVTTARTRPPASSGPGTAGRPSSPRRRCGSSQPAPASRRSSCR
jgi:hypothetical protein